MWDPADSEDGSFEIFLDRTSQSHRCSRDDTLLRAGLRAGFRLPYECNVGQCGSCKIQLLEGDVSSTQGASSALPARDFERGRRLACQSFPLSNCRIRYLGSPADTEAAAIRPQRFLAELTATRDVTHDMREFRFRTTEPARFLPGQYALLDLNGVQGSRAYSMANLPNADGEWDFIVRKVPGGAGTSALFDTEIGQKLRLDAPYGHAFLRETPERNVCCIAGGSGLAPMLSIARAFDARPEYGSFNLQFLFGGRTAADICGMSELEQLPSFGRRIFFHSAVSTTEAAAGHEQKFIHELLLDEFGDRLETLDFYCAGPPPMIGALTAALHEKSVSKDRIRYDRFF